MSMAGPLALKTSNNMYSTRLSCPLWNIWWILC
jgi:hypothetical protein